MTSFNDGIEAAAQELQRVADLHEQSCCGLWSRAAQQRALLKRDVLQEMSNRVRALKRPEPSEALPADVCRLVIAARKVAFEDQGPEALRELDKASEAFAGLVPWEGEHLRRHGMAVD